MSTRDRLAEWLRENHAACCLQNDTVAPASLAEALLNYSPLAESRVAELEATVARVEALPHEDFCCAKGCPGPGFCEGCEGTESDCKCIVAHVRAALSGRGNAASGEKWQALRAAFSDPFNRRARLLDADTHEVAP